jgi:hypothetical protein
VGQARRPNDAQAFAQVGGLLAALGAPPSVLSLQARLAPASLRQGVGLAVGGAPQREICLYVHHVEPDSGREHCDAYKWRSGQAAEHSFYVFHFLPRTPGGITPDTLIHTDQLNLYRSLMTDPRLAAISGFWLRHRGEGIDQISLTYPWQPTVESIAGLDAGLGEWTAHLSPFRDHHLRHIAFSGACAANPELTLYFSGQIGAPWPESFAQLRQSVNQSARRSNQAIEAQIFARLPAGGRALPPGPACTTQVSLEREAETADRLMPHLLEVIAPGASVYLIGCGWGTVATRLWQALGCQSVGITSDMEQYAFCSGRGLKTRLGDPLTALPPGKFEYILILEDVAESHDLAMLNLFSAKILVYADGGNDVGNGVFLQPASDI